MGVIRINMQNTPKAEQEMRNIKQIDQLVNELGPFTPEELQLLATYDVPLKTSIESMHHTDNNSNGEERTYWRGNK